MNLSLEHQAALQNEISYIDFLKREIKSHQKPLSQVGGMAAAPPAFTTIEAQIDQVRANQDTKINLVKDILTKETQNLKARIVALSGLINTEDGNIQRALQSIDGEIKQLESDIALLGFDTAATPSVTDAGTSIGALTNPSGPVSVLAGGGSSVYTAKYLKYKQKYLQLKNRL